MDWIVGWVACIEREHRCMGVGAWGQGGIDGAGLRGCWGWLLGWLGCWAVDVWRGGPGR